MSSEPCDHRDCICSCGAASPVLPGSDSEFASDVLGAVVRHQRAVLGIVRKRPVITQLVGFQRYWDHVSRLVLEGGASFADDIASGVPLPVASERHGPSDAALLAAAEFVLLVAPSVLALNVVSDYVMAGAAASSLDHLMIEDGTAEAVEADTGPPVSLEREIEALRPRHQAMPGRGWPVTSLAPPVAA